MFSQEERKLLLELLTVEQSKYAQKGQDSIVDKIEVIKQKIIRLSSINNMNVFTA